jgi:hypothetical protein
MQFFSMEHANGYKTYQRIRFARFFHYFTRDNVFTDKFYSVAEKYFFCGNSRPGIESQFTNFNTGVQYNEFGVGTYNNGISPLGGHGDDVTIANKELHFATNNDTSGSAWLAWDFTGKRQAQRGALRRVRSYWFLFCYFRACYRDQGRVEVEPRNEVNTE